MHWGYSLFITCRKTACRLVFTIHTHSDPQTGFLQWSDKDTASLSQVFFVHWRGLSDNLLTFSDLQFIEHIFGSTDLSAFSSRLLFVVACGAVVEKSILEIKTLR